VETDSPAFLRAERDELEARLGESHARCRSLEQKLKQTLMHLVTAEGIRAERDQLRAEAEALRLELAARRAGEAGREQVEEHVPRDLDHEVDPGERLNEALSYLVRAESIRTEREELRAQLAELEHDNEQLRAEVARLGHPSVQRRPWFPRPARGD
jgi:DNA repair exonuclease SbcCD ATPase subunit